MGEVGRLEVGGHSDDDFSPGVALFQIPDGFSHVAQRVTPINDGDNFSGGKKIAQKNQIRLASPGQKEMHLLASYQ